MAQSRTMATLAVTAVLIGVNWLLYVYAVTSGHILAASFGYYLNPLANVLLGRFVLKERLSRLQWTAVAIAGAGISVLAAGALSELWISLTLCVSFALYGLMRKVVAADAIVGLSVETALLFPVALLWRLPYSTLGMLQFLAPTLQFLIAVLLYGETFTTAHAIAFAAIWAALALYVTALFRQSRAQPG
jgi:chloramphenicol-sensitive protein RarD